MRGDGIPLNKQRINKRGGLPKFIALQVARILYLSLCLVHIMSVHIYEIHNVSSEKRSLTQQILGIGYYDKTLFVVDTRLLYDLALSL